MNIRAFRLVPPNAVGTPVLAPVTRQVPRLIPPFSSGAVRCRMGPRQGGRTDTPKSVNSVAGSTISPELLGLGYDSRVGVLTSRFCPPRPTIRGRPNAYAGIGTLRSP